ncbi:MAG: hydrogenase maturation protease [bacterium]
MKWTVAGVGNILLGDEGVGVRVIQTLATRMLPPGVELLEAGVDPLALATPLKEGHGVIVVDAFSGHGPPGSIYLLPLTNLRPVEPFASLHDISFYHLLQDYQVQAGWAVGVEPERIDWGLDLSPAVAKAVPRAANLVSRLLWQK